MNQRSRFALLVLLALSLSCGETGTLPAVNATDTPYLPPATVGMPTLITPTNFLPPAATPSEYVPSTVTPYIPPTITPTEYIPPTVVASPTDYVAPAAIPVENDLTKAALLQGATLQPQIQQGPVLQSPQQMQPVQQVDIITQSEIDKKYLALGGEKGFLGAATEPENTAPDGTGRYRHYQGGSIYWTKDTGAWEVHGLIREKWASLGWETGFLGYPLTDESATPDGIGRYNHFQGGSIYWTPNTGAWEVHGDIRNKWASLGWENGCLGYPISDEEPSKGGWSRQSRFEHGVIRWSPAQGAVETCY